MYLRKGVGVPRDRGDIDMPPPPPHGYATLHTSVKLAELNQGHSR